MMTVNDNSRMIRMTMENKHINIQSTEMLALSPQSPMRC